MGRGMTPVDATTIPGVDALERGLAQVLGERLQVLEREPNWYGSTFPSEVVTCAVEAGELRLLCKYEHPWANDVNGHPAGVVYEAEVYRLAVEPSGLSAPRFYGLAIDPDTDATWLVVEHLSETLRVAKAPNPRAIIRAALWIGSFHRLHESARATAAGRINRHDRHYFVDFAKRALEHSAALETEHPFLAPLVEVFQAELVELLLDEQTVVHGDFYPENILERKGRIYPVDWASAAWSSGEIDFAALTEGHWEDKAVRAASAAYASARWGSEPTGDFAARVEAARMYLHFRAFADDPSAPFEPGAAWRCEQLRSAAERFLVRP
jgi:fructosamine-3-kinase